LTIDNARELGRAFADADVVRNYRHRPPYPDEVFDVLERLVVAPRVVLDAGCGTGALTRRLTRLAERVDAVDPSPAMIAEARGLPGGDDPRIRWIIARAEDAPLQPPYGLITTGASLHWMDPKTVMPRFRDALAPGASLAIADIEWVHPDHPWRSEFVALIRQYSPLDHGDDVAAFVDRLEKDRHFAPVGQQRTSAVPVSFSVDEYLALLASTSSLSGATLGPRRAAFEHEAREILARHGLARVRFDVVGIVAWGQPLG
jgi:SAM-dependent methyltransferase